MSKHTYEPSRAFMSFDVAGFSHWYGLQVLDQLRPGVKLRMVGEPDNPYDPNAVALYLGNTKIGYVPRSMNADLSLLLYYGHGKVFDVRVAQVRTDTHPEHQVRATIFLKDRRS